MPLRHLAAAAALIASSLALSAPPSAAAEAPRGPTAPFAVAVAAAQDTAPNFTGITNWFNSRPLTIADLR
ncbi:hypothetical protein ABTD88_19335, partial [Acinetobacter baumannii]